MKAGRELDALIAEKIFAKEITWFREADEPDEPAVLRDNAYIPIPHYSTDIKAAWLVVEKFDYLYLWNDLGSELGWECKLVAEDANDLYARNAETAPLAICLAALKAVE